MKYKGYFYKQIEVTDYKGDKATMYKCSDEALLEHVETSSFTKFTEKRMKEAIDFYIKNVDYFKELKELRFKATNEFLQTKHD